MRPHTLVTLLAIGALLVIGALVLVVIARRMPEPPPVEVQAGVSTTSRPAMVIDGIDLAAKPDPTLPIPSFAGSDPAPTREPTEQRTTCELGGWVRWQGPEGRPVESAWVGLLLPALVDDSEQSPVWMWRGARELMPARRQVQRGDRTDATGHFAFDELAAGTYVMYVDYGPLVATVTAPIRLEPGDMRGGVEIVLPATGGLRGRLLVPADVELDDWRVAMQRNEPGGVPPVVESGIPYDTIESRIADDGTFRIAPARPGRHSVWLVARTTPASRSRSGKLLIGEVEIPAGDDVERVFDLLGGFPGWLSVTLRIPMFERESAATNLRRISHLLSATPHAGRGEERLVNAFCRAGETVLLGPLRPGAWRLGVQSGVSSWVYESRLSETVLPGRTSDVTVEVELFEGILTCLDAETGAPLPASGLMVDPAGKDFGVSMKTDASGNVHLMLTTGTYSVSRYVRLDDGIDIAAGEIFEWLEDGPHPRSVQLLRPVTAPR